MVWRLLVSGCDSREDTAVWLFVFLKEQIELIKTKIGRGLNGIPLQLTLTQEQLFYFLGK